MEIKEAPPAALPVPVARGQCWTAKGHAGHFPLSVSVCNLTSEVAPAFTKKFVCLNHPLEIMD